MIIEYEVKTLLLIKHASLCVFCFGRPSFDLVLESPEGLALVGDRVEFTTESILAIEGHVTFPFKLPNMLQERVLPVVVGRRFQSLAWGGV